MVDLINREARGVRIALIDSGVDGSHPWLVHAALRHYQVERRGELCTVVEGASGDQAGHGTACAGIIHRMAPGAEISSISVLGPDGRAARDALLAGIRFVVRERFHVVNLSLGIDVPRLAALRPADHRSVVELYELADAAYTVGVVLVASGPNASDFRTYPGKFKSLIGVGRGSFADSETLRSAITPTTRSSPPATRSSRPRSAAESAAGPAPRSPAPTWSRTWPASAPRGPGSRSRPSRPRSTSSPRPAWMDTPRPARPRSR